MNRRNRALIALILILAMVLAACGSTASTSTATSVEEKPTVSVEEAVATVEQKPTVSVEEVVATVEQKPLRFRLKTEPDTLDPHKTAGTGDPQVVQYQLYESLFREEATSEIVPALAESYELNDDNSEITLHLRNDVYFHNGEKMTADDVVFSINRSMETGFNGSYVGAIEKVEKVDDSTVKVTMVYSYTPIVTCLSTLSAAIVSKSYLEQNGEDILARSPIGTGPYMLTNWISGDRLEFEAFNKYWRGEATIKNTSFVIIADNSTAAIALETGEIDVMTNLNTSDVPLIEKNPELSFVTGPAASMVLFSFNNQDGLFSDQRLREAFALSIDREEIIKIAADGIGEVQKPIILAVLPEYPENFEVPEKNIERAKELLAEAGYPDGFTVTVPTIDNPTYSKPTVMIQEQVAKAGITLVVDLMDRAAWNEKVISNTDYECTVWALPITALDADFVASKFYGKNINGGGNFSNCNIPELDELILAGRKLEPGTERNEVYLKISEIIRDNSVVIPIYTNMRNNACSANLGGVYPSSTLHMYMYDYYWIA